MYLIMFDTLWLASGSLFFLLASYLLNHFCSSSVKVHSIFYGVHGGLLGRSFFVYCNN